MLVEFVKGVVRVTVALIPTASLVTQGTNLSSQGAISPTYLRHFQWPNEACKQHIRGDFTEVSL
jgi:hypothetical protein